MYPRKNATSINQLLQQQQDLIRTLFEVGNFEEELRQARLLVENITGGRYYMGHRIPSAQIHTLDYQLNNMRISKHDNLEAQFIYARFVYCVRSKEKAVELYAKIYTDFYGKKSNAPKLKATSPSFDINHSYLFSQTPNDSDVVPTVILPSVEREEQKVQTESRELHWDPKKDEAIQPRSRSQSPIEFSPAITPPPLRRLVMN